MHRAHANNAAVDNDFHQTHAIFSLFEGLKVEDFDKPAVNGHQSNDVHGPIATEAPIAVHN